MPKTYKIEISSKSIVFTIIFLLVLKLLWQMHDLLLSLFMAFIIMSAVKPMTVFLEKRRIPRPLSAFVIFFLLFLSLIYFVVWFVPPLINETTLFWKEFPLLVNEINPSFSNYLNLNAVSQYLPNITNQIFQLAKGLVFNIVFFLSTLFFSFYLTIEEDFIKKILVKFFEEKKALRVAAIFDSIEQRLNAWLWGELTLMMIIGVMTYIGLSLLHIKYALPLSIIAGLLEAIPNFGPTISAVPAFIVGFTQSPILAFSAIALYFIIQQLENNFIVPLVMRKAVGLNPVVTMIAFVVGGRLAGVLGIILAIPLTLVFETILVEILQYNKAS